MTSLTLLIMFFLFMTSAFNLIMSSKTLFIDWEVFNINPLTIMMSMVLDWKSSLFLATVSLISAFIMIYSIYYMAGDPNSLRFTLLLSSFILSMMLLIVSPNIISMMLGWDGLGLTSYLLVIYFQNESSMNSGMTTILSNRVGDSTLLMAIAWFMYMGSYNFMSFSSLDNLLAFLIIISAMTKSAQIPFSAWLPEAMAAPTPVSALVHSSTLVTAGVFLMIRFSPYTSEKMLSMCLLVGLTTSLMAGWVANFETDFKKVVALSTLSQLGLMFVILGLSKPDLAFFHLLMHALFKSTLFMCAGFIIHNLSNTQDSRFNGNFSYSTPVLGTLFVATNISLCGFPFMTGFYSKDLILETTFSLFTNYFFYLTLIIATALTLSYSLRVLYMTSSMKMKNKPLKPSSYFDKNITTSTMALFALSTAGGYIFSWVLSDKLMLSLLYTEKFVISSALIMMMMFIVTYMSTNSKYSMLSKWASYLMYFLPKLTKNISPSAFLSVSTYNNKVAEKGWLEHSGPLYIKNNFIYLSLKLNKSSLMIFISQSLLALALTMMFIMC